MPTVPVKAKSSGQEAKGARTSKTPRLADIAQAVGVSVQAVSLVLREKEGVSPAMRERIQKEIRRVGYRRNRFAQKFFSKSTRTFGVVVPKLSHNWYSVLVEELHDQALALDFDLDIFLTNYDPAQEEKVLEDLIGMRVDGIVLCSRYWDAADIPRSHYLKSTASDSAKTPLVLNAPIKDCDFPAVTQDISHGVREAVNHLHERGHTAIALVTPVNEAVERIGSYHARLEGLRLGLLDHDLSIDPLPVIQAEFPKSRVVPWTQSNPHFDQFFKVSEILTRKVLATEPRPTALICSNDAVANHIIQHLIRTGYSIPRDFAVVGCDGTFLAEMGAVPLTSITYNLREQAQQMISELLSYSRSKSRGKVRKVTPRFIIREST